MYIFLHIELCYAKMYVCKKKIEYTGDIMYYINEYISIYGKLELIYFLYIYTHTVSYFITCLLWSEYNI